MSKTEKQYEVQTEILKRICAIEKTMGKIEVLYAYLKAKDRDFKATERKVKAAMGSSFAAKKRYLAKKAESDTAYSKFVHATRYPRRKTDTPSKCKPLFDKLVNRGIRPEEILHQADRYADANKGNEYTYGLRRFLEDFDIVAGSSQAELLCVKKDDVESFRKEAEELRDAANQMIMIGGDIELANKLLREAEEIEQKLGANYGL